MADLVVSANFLSDLVLEIVQGLLWENMGNKSSFYKKIAFTILECEQFFNIQVTKCSSDDTCLTYLLRLVLTKYLKTFIVSRNTPIAIIQKKSNNNIQIKRVTMSRKSVCFIDEKMSDQQNEFSSLKRYTSVKLLDKNYLQLKVGKCYVEEFAKSIVSFIKLMNCIDSNIKFVLKMGDTYIYRNFVPMDDIVLSSKVISSACHTIFSNSQDQQYQEDLMNMLSIRKASAFEATLGCLMLAQIDNNFMGTNN